MSKFVGTTFQESDKKPIVIEITVKEESGTKSKTVKNESPR